MTDRVLEGGTTTRKLEGGSTVRTLEGVSTTPVNRTWNVRHDLIQFTNRTWNVRHDVSQFVNRTWNVRADILNFVNRTWNVRHDLIQFVNRTWTVRHDLAGIVNRIWSVRHDLSNFINRIWNVRHDISQFTSRIWNVRSDISEFVNRTWNVRSDIINFVNQVWNVRHDINAALLVNRTWNVRHDLFQFINRVWNVRHNIILEILQQLGGYSPTIYRPLRWVKLLQSDKFNKITIIVHIPKSEKRSLFDIVGQIYWTPESNSKIIVVSDVNTQLIDNIKIIKNISNYLVNKSRIGYEYITNFIMPIKVSIAGDIADSKTSIIKVKENSDTWSCNKNECVIKNDIVLSTKRNKINLITLEEIVALVQDDNTA